MDRPPEYKKWTKEALIRKIQILETAAQARSDPNAANSSSIQKQATGGDESPPPREAKKKPDKKIDPSKFSTRLVAFKLAYIGKNYGGFEFQVSAQLPTIEEELWKALVRACLIFPENPDEVKWEEWEYSKCGRTDRGVSAFGQVIGIKVRSNRPLPKKPVEETKPDGGATSASENEMGMAVEKESDIQLVEEKPFDDFSDEIQYCRVLNRLLPPDIRMLAWCPTTPAEFSARHHCRERQYRYFFTQPAYSPIPRGLENPKASSAVKDGWLDVDAMRQAAKKFEGTHDFRNFCKIDPGKLITNFNRNIFECDVVQVKDVETAMPYLGKDEFRPANMAANTEPFPKVYYFHVRGSAFLWHQIRCMVAIIFMVGQGLEAPSIIDELLDHEKQPQRPNYTLASEYPLVLWDCIFPNLEATEDNERINSIDWAYMGEDSPLNQHGATGLVDQMWGYWRERKIDEILSGQLLNIVTAQADISLRRDRKAPEFAPLSQRTFEGGNRERLVGKYQSVLKKAKLAAPEDTYDKEARRKGYANANEWREARAKKHEAAMEAIEDS
ncbi:pseudouridine synthase [Pseudomassariella vexata]|uniref:Pseudouridine synthase n=1 Tax=Pseudomassariella vexata TaxID=1141098 RepID=A0A1Y2D8X0_9PEZI|nr:pseudouridine synthase [Pseudomassariella vexata]ORY55085.1 pseudouridine synthase [Pseudomassariella vexata]